MLPELQPASGPEESFITELPPMDGPVCLQMLMSHVVSPSEFYVHLVTPDAGLLDVMMDELNKFYGGKLVVTCNYFSLEMLISSFRFRGSTSGGHPQTRK